MKRLAIAFAALLATAPMASAQSVYFDYYSDSFPGQRTSRDYFLRTEPGGIVVYRSDNFPDDTDGPNIFFINKVNCKRKMWLVHQRYENGVLDWSVSAKPGDGNWMSVPLRKAEQFNWACSWAESYYRPTTD